MEPDKPVNQMKEDDLVIYIQWLHRLLGIEADIPASTDLKEYVYELRRKCSDRY